MSSLMNLWYIDLDMLNSLHNQISDNVIEVVKSTNKRGKLTNGLSFALSKLTPINIGGNLEFDTERGFSVEERIAPTVETKVKKVIDKISETSSFLSDTLSSENADVGYNYINGYFALDEIYRKSSPYENILWDINKIKCAEDYVWHLKFLPNYIMPKGFSSKRHSIIAMHYQVQEIDFSQEDYDVDLYVDGANIKANLKHLTKQIEYRRPFYFEILGWIDYFGDNHYNIKPVAILR